LRVLAGGVVLGFFVVVVWAVAVAEARTVKVLIDGDSQILLGDCEYNIVYRSSRIWTGSDLLKDFYLRKGIRIVYVPLKPDSGTIKKYFRSFKVCGRVRDDSSGLAREERYLMLAVYNGEVAYSGAAVPLAGLFPIEIVKLSGSGKCITVDAGRLPSGSKKLAIAITWDVDCDHESELPTEIHFRVWLENNEVKVEENTGTATSTPKPTVTSTGSVTVLTPSSSVSVEREKYAVLGVVAAVAVMAVVALAGPWRRR